MLIWAFCNAQAELLELNAEAVDGAIQAVLAALASGLTWAEVCSRHAPLASGDGSGCTARLGHSNSIEHMKAMLCSTNAWQFMLMKACWSFCLQKYICVE